LLRSLECARAPVKPRRPACALLQTLCRYSQHDCCKTLLYMPGSMRLTPYRATHPGSSECCTDPMGSPDHPHSCRMETMLMHAPMAAHDSFRKLPCNNPAPRRPRPTRRSGCEARRACTCARMCMHHALVCNQPGRYSAPALQSAFAAAAAARFACAGSMTHWRSARLLPHCNAQ